MTTHDAAGEMQVFVKRDGRDPKCVEVQSDATVGDLRVAANATRRVMSFGGVELWEDDSTLADIGVGAEAVVDIGPPTITLTVTVKVFQEGAEQPTVRETAVFHVRGATLADFGRNFGRQIRQKCIEANPSLSQVHLKPRWPSSIIPLQADILQLKSEMAGIGIIPHLLDPEDLIKQMDHAMSGESSQAFGRLPHRRDLPRYIAVISDIKLPMIRGEGCRSPRGRGCCEGDVGCAVM